LQFAKRFGRLRPVAGVDFGVVAGKKEPNSWYCEVISLPASRGTPFAEEIFCAPDKTKSGEQKSTKMIA
jgi:hypothetical protein